MGLPNFFQVLILLTISWNAVAVDLVSEVGSINSENCALEMGKIEQRIDSITSDEIKRSLLTQGHQTVLDETWSTKLGAHQKLRELYQQGRLERGCANATRGALRALRTFEDHIGEDLHRRFKETIRFPDNAFAAGNPHVRRAQEFSRFDLKKDLQSGDVILTRGNAYTSAAIASLGEFDTQFSHMSLVHKDEAGKIWTVEAHIEVGSFVRELEEHIEDKNYRTMVFRFDDPAIARAAAHYMFHKVKKASDSTGNILYDFGFDQDENSQLFCSEIVSYGYSHVSQDQVSIPMFRSRLQSRKAEFVKMLGITATESFIPGDIEVDPRFRIVAEWRDSARTNDNLQKDAVLQAMFRWSDEFGYRMIQGSSKKSFLYRNVGWPLRRVPYLKKYFVDKMPINMSRKLIGYFGVLESIGELLQKDLKLYDEETTAQRGVPLLRNEKYQVINAFRLRDLESQKPKLHRMYRPGRK